MSREKKERNKSKKYGEAIEDAYDESDRTLNHEDAHRNVVYKPASTLSQIGTCYMTQMKRFTRERSIWLLVLLLVMIPVLYVVFDWIDIGMFEETDIANLYMYTLLALLPLMSMFIACTLCGAMLPQEFNERTVYLSLPLPMNRSTFYFGKFLSGLTLTLGVITAAYGIAFIIAMNNTSVMYTASLFKSLLIALCGATCFCSIAYYLSAKSKRGSALKPLILMFAFMPIVAFVLSYVSMKTDIAALNTIAGYMPCFAPDLAMTYLGSSQFGCLSLYGILDMTGLLGLMKLPFGLGANQVVMCAVCIIISVVVMIAGYLKMKRRDM